MNDLRQFLQKHKLSQASIARSLGVSPTAISQYLNGIYGDKGGDAATLESKITTYMANYLQQASTASDSELVETDDLRMVDFICSETASNKEMGTVYGKAGTGKTIAVKEFASKHPEAIVVESMPMNTPKGLLVNILEHLGQREAQGSFESLHKQAVDIFKRSDRILVIDEAENLTTKSLETIRRLHDFSGVPVILVGTHALLQNLKGRRGELLQLYSRINNKHEIIVGIQRIFALSLRNTPPAETITITAQAWAETLYHSNIEWTQNQDQQRLYQSFLILSRNIERWPAPQDLLKHLPERPQTYLLPPPKLTAQQKADNLKKIQALLTTLQ